MKIGKKFHREGEELAHHGATIPPPQLMVSGSVSYVA